MTKFTPNHAHALHFWQSHPDYKASPLMMSDALLPQQKIAIKDESGRLNLGSFKALGGIYAVAKLIAEHVPSFKDMPISYERLLSKDARNVANKLRFVCASAGNHGLAVATGAKTFGAKAHIFLSHQVPIEFGERLTALGANVIYSGDTYEQSVADAIDYAQQHDALLLADGSWEGYTIPPSLVMEGYTTIATELKQSFDVTKQWPSHVFLQAGVGGLAAAITYMIRHNWAKQPKIIIVEPNRAACLKLSHEAGVLTQAVGAVSNMGRLDCKDASLLAYDTLAASGVEYLTISDLEATNALPDLAKIGMLSTESGAGGYIGLKKYLEFNQVDEQFEPLIIISEGGL